MAHKTSLTAQDRKIVIQFFYFIAVATLISSVLFESPSTTYEGFKRILASPSMLNSDYFAIGGISATLLNAGINMFIMTFLVHILKAPMSGILIASMFSVFGCSFYGTNFLNSTPIVLGGFAYANVMGIKPGLPIIFFSTGASAIVSTLALNGFFSLPAGIVAGSRIFDRPGHTWRRWCPGCLPQRL